MQDGDNQLKMREEETDAFSVRSDLEDDNIESTEKIDNINQAEAAEEQQTSQVEMSDIKQEEEATDQQENDIQNFQIPVSTINNKEETESGQSQKVSSRKQLINEEENIQNKTQKRDSKSGLTPILQTKKRDISNILVEPETAPRRDKANLNYPEPREGRGEAKNGIKTTTFIIQKYIEQPALINGRKFDIRVWVLLDQNQDVFFFEEGYLRMSGYEYTMSNDNLDDDFIHLTNNAIQKNCPNYGAHEDGNQLSFNDLKKWLKSIGNKSTDFENFILPKMKYQAAVSLYSARKKFNTSKRKHCFELFGFDYILDKDLNVFLIECNTNPCIEESSKILKRLLPRMLDDMFKLTIDQIYQSSKVQDQSTFLSYSKSPMKNPKVSEVQNSGSEQKASIYHVPGYKDTHNMWERIGTIKSSNQMQNPIFVENPKHLYQVSQSERMIQLVNQFEMRVAKTELIDKLIRRDNAVNATAQLAFANF